MAGLERQDAELEAARADAASAVAEGDDALDEVAGLRAALRQMTRQRNAS